MPSKHTSALKKSISKNGAHHPRRHTIHNALNRNESRSHARRGAKKPHLNKEDVTKLALAVTAAGIAGTAAFMLFGRNKSSLEELYESYSDFKDDASDMAHNAFETGKKAYNVASEFAENIKDAAYGASEGPLSNKYIIAGSIGSVLVGASLIYLFSKNRERYSDNLLGRARKYAQSIRRSAEDVSENVKSVDWIGKAKEFLDLVTEKVTPEFEENYSGGKKRSIDLEDAINFAVMGVRLWKTLKNKNR